jgi:hypothetical protein
MDEEPKPNYTLGDLMRVARKKREQGLESLTDEEREILRAGEAFSERMLASIPPEVFQDAARAMGAYDRIKDAYEDLPPEEQMRYGDWSVMHLRGLSPSHRRAGEKGGRGRRLARSRL